MLLLCPHDGLRLSLIYDAPSGQKAEEVLCFQTGPLWLIGNLGKGIAIFQLYTNYNNLYSIEYLIIFC